MTARKHRIIYKCTKSCKTILRTEQAAKSEIAFSRMAFNNGNETYKLIRYYFCNHCKGYHLTRQEKRIKEAV